MSTVEALNAAEAEATATKHVMRVMDPKAGDMKVVWDAENTEEVAQARGTFDSMRRKGFTAYGVTRRGKKAEVMTEFDPDAEAIILAPAVVGG